VNIITPSTAAALNFTMIPSQRTIATAGKGAEIMSIGYMNSGPPLGRLHVVPRIQQNLLSVNKLREGGLGITFDIDRTCRIFDNHGLELCILMDKRTQLFYVDIKHLIQVFHNVQPTQDISIPKRQDMQVSTTVMKPKRPKDLIIEVMRLHRCLGHASFRSMATGIRDGMIVGTELSYADIVAVSKRLDCKSCACAKWTRKSIPVGSGIVTNNPFETISLDPIGPYSPAAIGERRYGILAVELGFGFLVGTLAKQINGTTMIKFMETIKGFASRYRHHIRCVRFDAGTVENSKQFITYLSDCNIQPAPAASEHQHQNPVERSVRTVKENLAAIMIDQTQLLPMFWGLGFLMTIQSRNMIANGKCPSSSPNYEIMGILTDMSTMATHYFGEPVVVSKSLAKQRKGNITDTRNELAVIVGFGNLLNKSWLCYRIGYPMNQLVQRYDVKSLKVGDAERLTHEEGIRLITQDSGMSTTFIKTRSFVEPLMAEKPIMASHGDIWANDLLSSLPAIPPIDRDKIDDEHLRKNETATEKAEEAVPAGTEQVETGEMEEPKRSFEDTYDTENDYWTASLIAASIIYELPRDDEDDMDHLLFIGNTLMQQQLLPDLLPMLQDTGTQNHAITHPTRRESMTSIDAPHWRAAEKKEMDMLLERGAIVREAMPTGMRAVPTKWVLVKKDSGVYKARLVACGNRENFDGATYSPTTNKSVMWLMFALTVFYDLRTRVIDVTGAFTSEKCPREVFLRIEKDIFKLKMNLYGLSDAAREFNERITEHIIGYGYTHSKFDQCLFFKWNSMTEFIYIIVHVDDFHCNATSDDMIDEFVRMLRNKYEVTDKPLDSYLGITIKRNSDGSRLFTRPQQLEKNI
jgi:hypothetical protein